MKQPLVQGYKRVVAGLRRKLTSISGSLSGQRDRRRLQSLEQALTTMEEECLSLRQEMADLVQYADNETQRLKRQIEHLEKVQESLRRERDDFQLRIWELEQENDRLEQENAYLVEHVTQVTPVPLMTSEATDGEVSRESDGLDPPMNLAHLHVALVGGHAATRRGVLEVLCGHHGLQRYVEVPPFSEVNADRNKLKAKLQLCDLVVIITGYMNHSLANLVYDLKQTGALRAEIIPLTPRGKSGVVREILNHIARHKSLRQRPQD